MRNLTSLLLVITVMLCLNGCENKAKNPTGPSNIRQAPEAPTNLIALLGGRGEFKLKWKDNSNNEDGFEVHESIANDSGFVKIATTRANVDSISLTAKEPQQTYYYKVRAYNNYGYSVFSNVAVVQSGVLCNTFPKQESTFRCVKFFNDDYYLLSGSGDNKVRVWDVYSQRITKVMIGHRHGIKGVDYNSRYFTIVSSSPESRQIIVWNSEGGGVLAELNGTYAKFSRDGQYLAVLDDIVVLYRGNKFDEILPLERYSAKWFDFDAESRYLFIVQEDSIRKIRLEDLTQLNVYRLSNFTISNAYALSPDGNFIAQAQEAQALIWRLSDGAVIANLRGHERPIQAITFSPDGLWLASGASDMKIIIWEVLTGNALWQLSGHTNPVYGIDFSSDGARLASASGDCTIKIWGYFK